eukprot:TRINITY_DN28360_c0_g1_i1.p1 TRINITY_DN28360_c0_g1~~TRINITY_DN28360_c0_g1_i1.p1  ORF type:complete len:185 (+),score=58.82 TRINITY_DN28360_c0_g1_i1:129-683(+)
MIRRPPRSTLSSSSAASDVYKRQVSSNADGVLFTCSAFGSCIEQVKQKYPQMPVLKPNEAMMEEAVMIGGKIGVLSVFEPTVGSIVREMNEMAASLGKEVDVTARFIPGALDILRGGDEARYNRVVADAAGEMRDEIECDVMVLAMFSMACCGPAVAARLGPEVPTLTSPVSAVEKMKRLLSSP